MWNGDGAARAVVRRSLVRIKVKRVERALFENGDVSRESGVSVFSVVSSCTFFLLAIFFFFFLLLLLFPVPPALDIPLRSLLILPSAVLRLLLLPPLPFLPLIYLLPPRTLQENLKPNPDIAPNQKQILVQP